MQAEEQKELFVFILMPFEPEFDGIYANLILPALESEDCRVQRADSFVNQQNILKDIIQNIEKADLIIADLTSLNPNVMYELGIAHALSKPTILLTQTLQELPFDLRSYRAIAYATSYDKVKDLQKNLRTIVQKFREGSISFGNPVSDFASNQPSKAMKFHATPVVKTEEIEALRYRQKAADLLMEFGEHYNRINELNSEFNEKLSEYRIKILSCLDFDTLGTAAKVSETSRVLASEMINHSQNIETELDVIHNLWEGYFENMIGFINTVNVESINIQEIIRDLISNLRKMLENVRKSLSAVQGVKESLQKLKMVKYLKHPVRRYLVTLDRYIDVFTMVESSLVRLLNLITKSCPED